MGSSFSNYVSVNYEQWTQPDVTPDFTQQAKHDPLLGAEGRAERISPLSDEEMRIRGLPAGRRDYCGQYHIALMECRKKNFPLFYRCEHQEHDLHHCQYDDFTSQLKEYERERRLLKRDLRRKEKGLDAAEAN